MKKRIIIIICVLLAIVLLVPIPLRLKDGGTVVYQAVLYRVEDVHRLDHNAENGYIEGIVITVLGFEIYNDLENRK